LLTQVRSERLMRMVLDVARGAVYVLPLGDDRLLVAVTLVQSQVDMADQKVRLLHKHIRSAWPPRQ
jgi:predicted regulator of Ras-like GTPase activity (Roadblock/LC7/MglB family)